MNFLLKPGMQLGAATAATQIEGGDQNNNWYGWYRRGHIKDGSDPSIATEHFARWREDLDLMAEMGIQCYRFSVEWSRVEPEEDVYDELAIARYRLEIQALIQRGIRPLLTLHHFSIPMWLEVKGGFTKRENILCYLRYVLKMVKSFGDLVSEYITINEPNVYAFNSYLVGLWPPGWRSVRLVREVLTNLAACHIEAYGLIRKTRLRMGYKDTKVSFANHLRAFAPKNPGDPFHRFCAEKAEELFQGGLTRAMCLGETAYPLRYDPIISPGQYCDFHAVNYYTRSTLAGPRDGVPEHCPVNDLGWEIYPQGIVEVCRKVYALLPRPIYITENGTCDNEDRFRARYIAEHLRDLCLSDLPVERYYHWCFCDNWEWVDGETARFGLVHVDYESQKRTVKRSGEFYRQIIAQGGVTEEMFDTYCAGEYPVEEG